MVPLIVQLVATVIARSRYPLRDAARIGLAVMFVFTAGSHFSSLKHDLAAMVPPPLTGQLWTIYVTGILLAAGGVGILTHRLRRPAAWGLIALLAALFPANVYATLTGVTLNGAPVTPLLWRAPLQAFWIVGVWWTTLRTAAPTAASARLETA